MKKEIECLIPAARKKCECEWCKTSKFMSSVAIRQVIQYEIDKIFYDIIINKEVKKCQTKTKKTKKKK